MTGTKEIIIGYNSVDFADKYINSFVFAFNLNIIDIKHLEYSDGYHDEEQIAFLILFEVPNSFMCFERKAVMNFICDAEYDSKEGCWFSEGIDLETAKYLFKDCKKKNGKIYVK